MDASLESLVSLERLSNVRFPDSQTNDASFNLDEPRRLTKKADASCEYCPCPKAFHGFSPSDFDLSVDPPQSPTLFHDYQAFPRNARRLRFLHRLAQNPAESCLLVLAGCHAPCNGEGPSRAHHQASGNSFELLKTGIDERLVHR